MLFDKIVKYYLMCANLSSADELLLTEMVFNGLFNDLTVEQATALLSCFVFQENVRTNTHKHTQFLLILHTNRYLSLIPNNETND